MKELEAEAEEILERASAKTITTDAEPDDSDDILNKLKNLHNTELKNMKDGLAHKAAARREQLKARLAAKKAEKMAKLAEKGATESQVEAAERLAVTQAKAAVRKLENEIKHEEEAAVQELKQAQNEAIAGGVVDENTYDMELARLKTVHDAGISSLNAQLEDSKRDRREQLKKRLETRKRSRKAAMSKQGASDDEIDREMDNLDKGGDKPTMGKDALYAQEDSSSLSAVLEARSSQAGGGGPGPPAAAWTGSSLCEALGGEVRSVGRYLLCKARPEEVDTLLPTDSLRLAHLHLLDLGVPIISLQVLVRVVLVNLVSARLNALRKELCVETVLRIYELRQRILFNVTKRCKEFGPIVDG